MSNSQALIQMLEANGWTYVRDTGKKHRLYHCPCGKHSVAAPLHGADVSCSPIEQRVKRCARERGTK